jgi:hypothetical protein
VGCEREQARGVSARGERECEGRERVKGIEREREGGREGERRAESDGVRESAEGV